MFVWEAPSFLFKLRLVAASATGLAAGFKLSLVAASATGLAAGFKLAFPNFLR